MKSEEMVFCQSCGMPLLKSEDFGTEADGTPSKDYCTYCYQKGHFTQECTMEQMIDHCAQFHDQFKDENGQGYTREEAIAQMRLYFPQLKRWKK